jgi:hypothetical protein
MVRLLADDYVFTSPQDDHIATAAFMASCFPTAERFATQISSSWLRRAAAVSS